MRHDWTVGKVRHTKVLPTSYAYAVISLTIHLGPLASTMDPGLGIKPNPRPADGYGDNPRCHRRDVNNYFTSKFLKPDDLLKQITSSPDILTFQNTLQNTDVPMGALHTGGHFSIWGDPGGDVFVSPNEPTFWLHHGQLDRHWWMWANYQDREIANRTVQYEGKMPLVMLIDLG